MTEEQRLKREQRSSEPHLIAERERKRDDELYDRRCQREREGGRELPQVVGRREIMMANDACVKISKSSSSSSSTSSSAASSLLSSPSGSALSLSASPPLSSLCEL